MCSVVVKDNNGWLSTFLVDNKVTVETVDIYTYRCQSCEDNMKCEHVKAVTSYIEKGLDMFCQALDLKDSVKEMRGALDDLGAYVELRYHVMEATKDVKEMKNKIKTLRHYVISLKA